MSWQQRTRCGFLLTTFTMHSLSSMYCFSKSKWDLIPEAERELYLLQTCAELWLSRCVSAALVNAYTPRAFCKHLDRLDQGL
jgi:hypothetical protein